MGFAALNPSYALPDRSLHLEADRIHDRRPLLHLLGDQAREILRRSPARLESGLRKTRSLLRRLQELVGFAVQSCDQGGRHPGRAQDSVVSFIAKVVAK